MVNETADIFVLAMYRMFGVTGGMYKPMICCVAQLLTYLV
jgi:hypothetical protein